LIKVLLKKLKWFMNKKYWDAFYKKPHISAPSDFAEFCQTHYLKKRKTIIDFGCGNGRDSYYFAKSGHTVIGIDSAIKPENAHKCYFYKSSFSSPDIQWDGGKVVYSRFFLHAISNKEIKYLIEKSQGYFMAEARALGDKPLIWPNHDRNYIRGNWLLHQLIKNNFKILYFKQGRDMAVYKSENPLVIRVIAKKLKPKK